jgi:hypothetical protein
VPYSAGHLGGGRPAAPEETRRSVSKRSSWVAWSLLGANTVGIGTTAVLAVADGRLQRDWQGLIAQMLAFAAYSVIGALIVARRPGNAMGLGLLGHRPAGRDHAGGRRVRPVRLCDPAAPAARRDRCCLVSAHGRRCALFVDGDPAVAAVPDRPAALVPLAASAVDHRCRDRGADGADWPAPGLAAGRRPACDRQPVGVRRRGPAQGRPGGLGDRRPSHRGARLADPPLPAGSR